MTTDHNKYFRNYLLSTGLKLLVTEAVLLLVTWFLYQRASWLHKYPFTDMLFFLGVLLMMLASVGMLNRPYEVSESPMGVWAAPVQDNEEQKRRVALATFMQQRSFALRVTFLGLLNLLITGVLYLLNI